MVRRSCELGLKCGALMPLVRRLRSDGGKHMQVSFENEKLHQVVMDPVQSDWPSITARQDVEVLVADLMAASNLLEVPLGVPDLSLVSVDDFDLRAGDTVVLKCRVDHVKVRRLSNNDPDWLWIDRLMIIGRRENSQ